MKLLVINGPNLNLVGIREPELYGKKDFAALCKYIEDGAREMKLEVRLFQSNHEGEIVDEIQAALGVFDGIIINPGAYTHTSIAILDALKAVNLPAAEVHLTDINDREPFRRISYAGMACEAHFIGLGFEGYLEALKWFKVRHDTELRARESI